MQRVTSDAEQDITNGADEGDPAASSTKVYFAQGHGERDTAGSDGDGYGGIASALKADNFLAETLVLLQQDDSGRRVGARHRRTEVRLLLEPEIDKLKAYLAKGGKLLAMIDPPQKRGRAAADQPLALMKEWSVDVGNNAVLDPHEPAARRPARRAGRGALSVPSDHRTLRAAHRLSRTRGRSSRPRPAGRTHGARRSSRAAATAGRKATSSSLTTEGRGAAGLRQGRRPGPGVAGGRVSRADRRRDAAAGRRERGRADAEQAGDAARRGRRLRLRRQLRSRDPAATATCSSTW